MINGSGACSGHVLQSRNCFCQHPKSKLQEQSGKTFFVIANKYFLGVFKLKHTDNSKLPVSLTHTRLWTERSPDHLQEAAVPGENNQR